MCRADPRLPVTRQYAAAVPPAWESRRAEMRLRLGESTRWQRPLSSACAPALRCDVVARVRRKAHPRHADTARALRLLYRLRPLFLLHSSNARLAPRAGGVASRSLRSRACISTSRADFGGNARLGENVVSASAFAQLSVRSFKSARAAFTQSETP